MISEWARPWPVVTARALVVVRRNWLAWRRFMLSSIVANIVQPLITLLALGLGVGLFVQDVEGMPFMEFIAPGLLVGAGMTAVSFDVGYGVYDRLHWTRAYHAMIASPLMPEEIVAGEILWQMARTAFFGTAFLGILAAFGLVHSWWALTVPLLAALVGAGFAAPAIAVASVARTEEQLTYYFNLVIQPMFYFSGVFFPLSALGESVVRVAQWVPFYHAVTLARMATTGQVMGDPVYHGVCLLLFLVVAGLLPVPFLRRALERVQ